MTLIIYGIWLAVQYLLLVLADGGYYDYFFPFQDGLSSYDESEFIVYGFILPLVLLALYFLLKNRWNTTSVLNYIETAFSRKCDALIYWFEKINNVLLWPVEKYNRLRNLIAIYSEFDNWSHILHKYPALIFFVIPGFFILGYGGLVVFYFLWGISFIYSLFAYCLSILIAFIIALFC